MKYLTSSFSPSMLSDGLEARIFEISEKSLIEDIRGVTLKAESRVGHEMTSKFLSLRWGLKVEFNRATVSLVAGDECLVCIPQLRFEEAREYTKAEISAAKFRFFYVQVTER